MDSAQLASTHRSLSVADLHAHGLLDDRGALLAALLGAGFEPDAADTLIDRVIAATPPPRTPYRTWSTADVAVLNDAIDVSGPRVLRSASVTELADRLGRSPKSVQSKLERLIAERDAPHAG